MKRLFSFKSLGSRDASETSLQVAPSCSRVLVRRSHSFSSGTMNGDFREGSLVSLSDLRRPVASCGNSPHQASSCQVHCHRPLHSHAVHKQGSPGSSRNPEISLENSPCCSPILSRCNVSHQSRFQERNEFLEQHTDGGNQEVKAGRQTEKCLSESGIDLSEDNRAYQSAVRLQEVQSTALSSIMYNKEEVRTYSLREVNDSFHDFSKQNCIRDDSGLASSWRHAKEGNKKSSHAFSGKLSMNFQDYDSESTATVEDIYTDSFAQDLMRKKTSFWRLAPSLYSSWETLSKTSFWRLDLSLYSSWKTLSNKLQAPMSVLARRAVLCLG